jgi:hypothetical protein
MGDGRWEMGDGRWEMGDGRWEMGDGSVTGVPPGSYPGYTRARRPCHYAFSP